MNRSENAVLHDYRPINRTLYPNNERVYYESRSSKNSSENGNCRLWSKYAIYGINIIFLVVGFLVLAMGVWLRTDSRFRDFLSERYRQAVHEAFWEAPTLYAFSYILIVLGCFLIIVVVFGCCGASTDLKLLLGIYAIGTFLLLVFTIGSGSYIIYTKDAIDVELSDALNYMVQHYYQGPSIVQESLDRLQQAFRCCGNAGCSDFTAFRQDPPRTCDLRCDGCHYRIWLALRIGFSVALAVFSIVIFAQMVAIALSITLICANEDEYELHSAPEKALGRYEHAVARYQRQLRNQNGFNGLKKNTYSPYSAYSGNGYRLEQY